MAFQIPATTPSSSSGEDIGALLLTDQLTSLSDADQDDVCRVVLMLITKTDGFLMMKCIVLFVNTVLVDQSSFAFKETHSVPLLTHRSFK